jgi:hypothetical protein
MQKELISLFKAVEIQDKKERDLKNLNINTIKYGFILDPLITLEYSSTEINEIIELIKKEYFTSGKQANSSFHKSWKKIAEASIEQLVIEQVLHYFTTYGFETLGIFNHDSVYIPKENLNIPEFEDDLPLMVIKGYTKKELIEKIRGLLSSGIAFKSETIDDLMVIWSGLNIPVERVEEVKNKEMKLRLYDELNQVPKNNVEFVRYLIYKSTGNTLLIKDKKTIEMIKATTLNCYKYFNNYHDITKLAEVFYRFKPIFLAFKANDKRIKPIINKIRKLAYKHHKPMKEDFLNNLTSLIKQQGVKLTKKDLGIELDKVNIFRKIRLAYALKYRTVDPESILYQIRNGKGYAKEFSVDESLKKKYERVYNYLINHIKNEIKQNIGNKKIYIPNNVVYALPSTEKQFVGNLPTGSYLSFNEEDILIGGYWKNQKGNRVDLDFSLRSVNQKFGWDSFYRSQSRDIMFSGDVTDAPEGATEVFYINANNKGNYNFGLHDYTRISGGVDYKFFIASQKITRLSKNYLVDPNTILFSLNLHIEGSETIGMLSTNTESRFYFFNTVLDKNISGRNDEANKHAIQYVIKFYKNCVSLNEVLGDFLVNSKKEADIDLSLESLEKDSIIKLLVRDKQ